MTEISLGACRALVVNTVWRHTIVRLHPLELRLACSSMGLELHHCLRKNCTAKYNIKKTKVLGLSFVYITDQNVSLNSVAELNCGTDSNSFE